MKLGVICKMCGGHMHEIFGYVQCDTCGFIIRSNGEEDYSEVEEVE